MRVHPPTRMLLVLIVLASFVLAIPAAGRTPRPVDISEGDPGDGVLSPSVQNDVPAPAPEQETEPATTTEDAVSVAPVVVTVHVIPLQVPVYLPLQGRFWIDTLWGFLPGTSFGIDGRWHHAR